ncbi:MAG: flagellar protein FlaG [Glycocaulis sp.]
MTTIASISGKEPAAALAVSPVQAASSATSRAGATAVQPADKPARQGNTDARDMLRQSEIIEQMRANLSASARTRLQIERDEETSGRFIYRLVNPETGETLRRWPPERFGDLISMLTNEGAGVVNERA